jgi:hypothetical protein
MVACNFDEPPLVAWSMAVLSQIRGRKADLRQGFVPQEQRVNTVAICLLVAGILGLVDGRFGWVFIAVAGILMLI